MPLFGNGAGGGFISELKSTLGLSSREYYEDEYDLYSDNYDDYSTYEAGYDQERRGFSNDYGYDYPDHPVEVIERDPRDARAGEYPYRRNELVLPNLYDIRDSFLPYERERRESVRRESFQSVDYLPSGSVERAAAAEQRSRPPRPGFADRGGSNRALSVIAPRRYDDAERVSASLKAGEVVVLDLNRVAPDLMRRILDFSFGVACYAGAQVESLSGKVFAITPGGPITEGERVRLRSQGVRL